MPRPKQPAATKATLEQYCKQEYERVFHQPMQSQHWPSVSTLEEEAKTTKEVAKYYTRAKQLAMKLEKLQKDIDTLKEDKITSRAGTNRVIHAAHGIVKFGFHLGSVARALAELLKDSPSQRNVRSGRRIIVERLVRSQVMKAPVDSAEKAEWRPATNRELAYITLLLGFGVILKGESIEQVIHREANAIGRLRKGLKDLEAEVAKPMQRLHITTKIGTPR